MITLWHENNGKLAIQMFLAMKKNIAKVLGFNLQICCMPFIAASMGSDERSLDCAIMTFKWKKTFTNKDKSHGIQELQQEQDHLIKNSMLLFENFLESELHSKLIINQMEK